MNRRLARYTYLPIFCCMHLAVEPTVQIFI